MALDFPNTPTAGQPFTNGGVTWIWDSVKWSPGATGGTGGYVPIAGGTMTGALILNADPTAALGAATKQYVDAHTSPGGAVISPTPPASPTQGALWWDDVSGQLFVSYNDGNSTQWVIANSESGTASYQVGPGLHINTATSPPTIDVVTPYLPLSGGTLTGPLQINQNAATPPGGQGAAQLLLMAPDNANTTLTLDAFGTGGPIVFTRRGRGTAAAPSAVQSGDSLLYIASQGYAATTWGTPQPSIDLLTTENWTATANGCQWVFQSVPAGTSAVVNSLFLNGNIATFASSIIIPTNGVLYLTGTAIASGARLFSDGSSTAIGIASSGGYFVVKNSAATANPLLIDNAGNMTFGGTLTNYIPPTTPQQGSFICASQITIVSGSLAGNLYYDGSSWRYVIAGYGISCYLSPSNGAVYWYSAPSGAAGAVATQKTTMSLDVNGNAWFAANVTAQLDVGVNRTLYIGTSGIIYFYDATNSTIGMAGSFKISGSYIYLSNATGNINGTSTGPLIYGDNNAIVLHLGTGTSPNAFIFQMNSGTNVCQINGAGTINMRQGYGCQGGSQGTVYPNCFNIDWVPGAHLWIDNVNQGLLAFQSDYRIKENVRPLGSKWDAVKALRPISYNLKNNEKLLSRRDPAERWGFLAHELQETLIKRAATGYKDAENVVQSPDPWVMLAAVVSTLQEAMARIEQLEGAR